MRTGKPKDAAASPLQDWINTSSVRTKPSLTDFKLTGSADEIRNVRWFARGASDELLSHPLLGRLTMAERNGLYAARLVHFLDDMALTETRIVNVAAQVISENRLRAVLPEHLAIDALKLYTDEGYHAYFTAHASRSIREAFSLEAREEPNVKIAAIEALVAEAPLPQRDMTWFMVGFVGETMITKAIVDTMRGNAHAAIDTLLLAHLEDEWVHAKYFSHLFTLVWPQLDAASKTYFGRLLPRIMLAFHTWDSGFYRQMLGHVGLSATECEQVLSKVVSESRHILRTRQMCTNTLQILARCEVFKDAGVRAGFVQAGLLDLDQMNTP